MKTVISLLVLLFSMGGAQTASTQTEVQTESQSTGAAAAADTTQLDVSAELRELRDMVVELRVLLTVTQNELQNTKAENYLMKERLVASETKVEVLEMVSSAQGTEIEDLKMQSAAQEAELTAMQTRLAVTETDIEHMKKDTAAQQTDLTTMNAEVMDLIKANAAQETEIVAVKTSMDTVETKMLNLSMSSAAVEAELAAVKSRLAATETEVLNLEKVITGQPKVAFSAALTNSGVVQSGNTPLNLVFTKIITNIGQAYSSTSGFFTAPVKGVYYFRFTVMAGADLKQWRSIRMLKNKMQVMYLTENEETGHVYLSSGVNLQLEAGDEVNMQIPPDNLLNDSVDNHSIFSGFLLFPL